MLVIRCGVAHETGSLRQDCDWAVLQAVLNPAFHPNQLLEAVTRTGEIHIFASQTAFHFFVECWKSLDPVKRKQLSGNELMACGVGNTTDDAARSLTNSGVSMRWTVPQLASQDLRENGLSWTLEQLEKKGFIPARSLHLWSKSWSASDKILRELKTSRHWHNWSAQTHEIYSLESGTTPTPPDIVHALNTQSPLCFAVKSAEVLDATIAAILRQTGHTSASQLPRSVQFSVWEKGALLRAQQLFLQSRLIPWTESQTLNNI